MKFLIIKISFLFIFLFNYIFSDDPDGTLCSTYTDCFDCIACGDCEPRCPFDVHIVDVMLDAQDLFGF